MLIRTATLNRRRLLAALGPAALTVPGIFGAKTKLPETDPTGEGPFYKPGAPERADLITTGVRGTPLLLTGRFLNTHGELLAGAILDVWEANWDGQYDNEGFTLRGKLQADRQGRYRLRTIVPKAYSTGGQNYRAAHIHVKASAPGHRLITTELYVKGDARNYQDFGVRPSLQLVLEGPSEARTASFDFILGSNG